MFREFAPAKINLFLHVLGRRPDGYHHLESLVSFAEVCDELTLTPGDALSLEVTGPFSARLAGDDNLVLKAVKAYTAVFGRSRAGAFSLRKNLPVASGIGGGSSDAAAALRLLAHANGVQPTDPRLMDAAKTLGADVPVCLDPAAPRLMHGIGHELGNRLHGFRYPALLVNPGVPVETRAVFTVLGLQPGERHTPDKPEVGNAENGVFRILESTRNDLEEPAISIAPVIAEVLARLRAVNGCRFARMSGSGATCFAIFDRQEEVANAAAFLRAGHPQWWIEVTAIKLPS